MFLHSCFAYIFVFYSRSLLHDRLGKKHFDLLPHHTYCTAYTQDTHIQLETVETYADCDVWRKVYAAAYDCFEKE